MNHKSITISIDFLEGVYNAPPSKSHMFRALFLSLISKKARIYNPLYNNDTNVLIDIFIKMGAIVDKNSKFLDIYFPKIDIQKVYDFKNSGTALRFMTTYLATVPRGAKASPNPHLKEGASVLEIPSPKKPPLGGLGALHLKEDSQNLEIPTPSKPPLGGLGASSLGENLQQVSDKASPNPLLKEGASSLEIPSPKKPPLGGLGALHLKEDSQNLEFPNSKKPPLGGLGASSLGGLGAPSVIHSSDPIFYEQLKKIAKDMRINPTKAESLLWKRLKNKQIGYKFRQQHIINRFIVDFCSIKLGLIIEVDGKIHKKHIERDKERTVLLEVEGYRVIRFKNEEIYNNINGVIERIIHIAQILEALLKEGASSLEDDSQQVSDKASPNPLLKEGALVLEIPSPKKPPLGGLGASSLKDDSQQVSDKASPNPLLKEGASSLEDSQQVSDKASPNPLLKEGASVLEIPSPKKPPLGGLGASSLKDDSQQVSDKASPNPLLKEGASVLEIPSPKKPPLGGLGALHPHEDSQNLEIPTPSKPPLGGLGALHPHEDSPVLEIPNSSKPPLGGLGALHPHEDSQNLEIPNSSKPPLGGLGASSLGGLGAYISGDEQLEKRKIEPLLTSLKKLGLKYSKLSENDLPFVIERGIRGGNTSISGKSSQFLSSLLLNLPFLDKDSTIEVKELHELPYINITLWWLDKFNIRYKNDNYNSFKIIGGQKLSPFEVVIPGDYSSTSFMILASVLNGDVEICGLDKDDPQGDKFIFTFLERIGLKINYTKYGFKVIGKVNRGGEFDLNDTPDLLPALALFSVNYNYDFKFYNVESARFKETDRITSIVKVLKSLGVEVNEFKDGLSFKGGLKKRINYVSGFNDHRIIMASSLLGIKKGYKVIISDIKNIEGSYPSYFNDLESLT